MKHPWIFKQSTVYDSNRPKLSVNLRHGVHVKLAKFGNTLVVSIKAEKSRTNVYCRRSLVLDLVVLLAAVRRRHRRRH